MSIAAFVQNLKPFLDKEGNLAPHLAEEYLHNGQLDLQYVQRVTESRTTQPKFNSLINSELGTVKFNNEAHVCEVTKQEFLEHYDFGKYPNVRSWIGHIHRVTGRLLTKDKLYEYILD